MNKFLTHLIALSMVVISLASASHAACPQPVYIIAHRCNQAGEVSAVVNSQSVNAIEADFRFNPIFPFPRGSWWVEHNDIDSDSTPLESWLNDVENAIADSDTLALVIFDIKSPEGNLLSLYEQARTSLGPEINLIFSFGDFFDAYVAYTVQSDFKAALNQDPRAGSAIDYLTGDQNQSLVQQAFDSLGVTDYWFGDGISAGWWSSSVEENVRAGMVLRNLSLFACDARFHGVYTWTYEKQSSITDYLSKAEDLFQIAGVNGIMMNTIECYTPWSISAWEPKDAVSYAKLWQVATGTRFATRTDNPFRVPAPGITCPPSTTVECSAPAGVSVDDPQLDAFFNGATIERRDCDAVGDAEVAAPGFFYLDEPASVVFTAADEGMCRPSNSCQADVAVVDTTAPSIMNITATPGVLWPPNGKMVPVTVDVTSTDTCDPAPVCRITSVTSNEPDGRAGRGNRSPDWMIAAGLELRAERSGAGDGRIYTITVECADASGNRAQGTVEVGVPHDQKHRS